MSGNSKKHDFAESLERSRSYSDAPWWFEVYRKAFPGLRSAVNVRDDGWAQRGGIDRVLTLASGRVILVDEKVRETDYGDILLERWSDEQRKIPGWIQKTLACEFIAYAIAPTRTCYLLPVLTLQRAWRLNGREWIPKYRRIEADNKRYITVSIAVPVDVLMAALSGAMCVVWDDYSAEDDFARSIDEAYGVVRERIANGGPGWNPADEDDKP